MFGGRSRTDIGDCGSNSDFDSRVSLLSQLPLKELVQFGEKDTIGDELATLADCSACCGRHFCGIALVKREVVNVAGFAASRC